MERIEYPIGVREYGLKQQWGEYTTCERVEFPNDSTEYDVGANAIDTSTLSRCRCSGLLLTCFRF